MFAKSIRIVAAGFFCVLVGPSLVQADIVIVPPPPSAGEYSFTTVDGQFDADSTLGDDEAELPDDNAPDDFSTLTTSSVMGATGTVESALSEGDGVLGVGVNTAFDNLESWEFSFDTKTTLQSITVRALADDASSFFIQSGAWAGDMFTVANPGDEEPILNFDSGSGRFEMLFPSTYVAGSTDPNVTFNFASLVTGDLQLDEGVTYSFFNDFEIPDDPMNLNPAHQLVGFNFATEATAVPEPGSAIALLGIAGIAVGRRVRRKKKAAAEVA